MLKKRNLKARMRGVPSQVMPELHDAFNESHTFVTEAHQLGGLALVLEWDMEADHRIELLAALAKHGAKLDSATAEALVDSPWEGVLQGTLHVGLSHAGPDEKVVVPRGTTESTIPPAAPVR